MLKPTENAPRRSFSLDEAGELIEVASRLDAASDNVSLDNLFTLLRLFKKK